ncbi:DUF1385 domain-containing protein [bacterium]|nr:DUF1385 domain-containing protein [bacterium]
MTAVGRVIPFFYAQTGLAGEEPDSSAGGQAVLEGVMMRSGNHFSVAVRKPDGTVLLQKKHYRSWTRRIKWLGLPFVRGGVILIESLALGIRALNFSSNVLMAETEGQGNKPSPKTNSSTGWTTAGLIVLSFAAGIGLFFTLPLLVTGWIGIRHGVLFNLVDGCLRLSFFMAYLFLINRMKDIRRVFEYHGAEHKAIFAHESGLPLTVGEVRNFSTHHPRCGTSFLLIVMLVSIGVFMFLGRPQDLSDRLIRFLFLPVIGGISYEIIRLGRSGFCGRLSRILILPGLWVQALTTREPDDSQMEVAIVALRAVLNLEMPDSIRIETV